MGFIGFLTKNKRRFESRRCGFLSFRLPSAANLRRFSSADSATGGADFKRPSKRKLSEKLTEGVRLRFYTNKQCFESQRCDLLLPSAFGSHLPLRGRSCFLYNYFLRAKKSSLLEGVELAARCAGGRQAERRRSVREAD